MASSGRARPAALHPAAASWVWYMALLASASRLCRGSDRMPCLQRAVLPVNSCKALQKAVLATHSQQAVNAHVGTLPAATQTNDADQRQPKSPCSPRASSLVPQRWGLWQTPPDKRPAHQHPCCCTLRLACVVGVSSRCMQPVALQPQQVSPSSVSLSTGPSGHRGVRELPQRHAPVSPSIPAAANPQNYIQRLTQHWSLRASGST